MYSSASRFALSSAALLIASASAAAARSFSAFCAAACAAAETPPLELVRPASFSFATLSFHSSYARRPLCAVTKRGAPPPSFTICERGVYASAGMSEPRIARSVAAGSCGRKPASNHSEICFSSKGPCTCPSRSR